MSAREPIVSPVPVGELRPTQITVGFREVQQKREEWRTRSTEAAGEFLGRHMLPTVLGPKGRHYLIDNHHLALALHLERAEHVLVIVEADLSSLGRKAFWTFLDNRSWCHLYDAKGRRRGFDDVPGSVAKLEDDPYRSLAGELRRAGGYAKDTAPFSEFLWADFLRPRVGRKQIEERFSVALAKALKLAKSPDANYLPGWSGPHED